MDFSEFKVNNTAAEGGVWVEHDEETKFLIARLGNKKFQNLFNKMMAPHQRQFSAGKLALDKQTEIMCRCMAKTILLGWDGLCMDGKALEYSEEKAYELLSMPGAEEFRDLITSYAQDAEIFRNEQVEEKVKN